MIANVRARAVPCRDVAKLRQQAIEAGIRWRRAQEDYLLACGEMQRRKHEYEQAQEDLERALVELIRAGGGEDV